MKKNFNILVIILSTLIVGIGIGYFIFGKKQSASTIVQHTAHNHHNDGSASNELSQEWTCSMHPQIRQNEPGLCPICEMDLIPVGGNESDDPLVLQMTAAAVQLANIQTSPVGDHSEKTPEKTIRLSGKVQVDERRTSSQVAHIPGRIEKLYVTFTGEQVAKGQKLAEIYAPDLITAQKELLEALKIQSINPGLLEAARNKLRFWKIPDSAIRDIESNGKIQETFPLYAMQSGIVTKRRVTVGDYLQKGEPLFDLINLQKVWVLFDAYEEDLKYIKTDSRIKFSTPAIPGKTFNTIVTFIDPLINPQTRTTAIRTEINNSRGLLKPEMFVNGILTSDFTPNTKDIITIPKTAVMWTGKRSVVYVKVPDVDIPSFQYREIEIGDRIGNSYQVLSGLENGEEVVTNGSFTIDAAAQLNNQTSMMNKDVHLKKEDTGGIPNFQATTPSAFKNQLYAVAEKYVILKDALVATDASAAATAAQGVLTLLEKVEMNLITGDTHIYWMEQLNALEAHTSKIINLTDIEAQRKQFDFLSQALINSVKAFGIGTNILYIQHCPMANNNTGADWLSNVQEIRNPYFGDKMLKCGLVKATIDAKLE